MRKNLGAKAFLYPMPVLVVGSYNDDGSADAMTAAWGAICDYTKITLALAKGHVTTHNIIERGAFTVSIATAETMVAADYVGLVSAAQEPHKVGKAGLTVVKSDLVDAPCFAEFAMTLECKLSEWDEVAERMIGEIVNVSAAENVLTNGKIDPAKLQPLTFDPVNNTYITLGAVAGRAFNAGLKLK